jgi:hypothetical protein
VILCYHLTIPRGKREHAERALAVFERARPMAQALEGRIAIDHSADVVEV